MGLLPLYIWGLNIDKNEKGFAIRMKRNRKSAEALIKKSQERNHQEFMSYSYNFLKEVNDHTYYFFLDSRLSPYPELHMLILRGFSMISPPVKAK